MRPIGIEIRAPRIFREALVFVRTVPNERREHPPAAATASGCADRHELARFQRVHSSANGATRDFSGSASDARAATAVRVRTTPRRTSPDAAPQRLKSPRKQKVHIGGTHA
jgi:hypothetical protein